MMSVSLGPFALPLDALLLLLSAGLFAATASFLARRRQCDEDVDLPHLASRGITLAIVSALLIARAVFVVKFWQQYSESPLQIFNIRDGGFIAPTGWFALAMILIFYSHRYKPLQRIYILSTVVALTLLVPANIAMALYKQGQGIPDASVLSLEGEMVSLKDFQGQPMVVNYWASWCPPCRREMPVLQAAQQANDKVTFVFVNQGETVTTVTDYLKQQQLSLNNVMLDKAQVLRQASGAAGLPTTLFFNADGQLVDMHMGEVSAAGLTSYVDNIAPSSEE